MEVSKVTAGGHQLGDFYHFEHLAANPYAVAWFGFSVDILDATHIPSPGHHKADFVDHNSDLLSLGCDDYIRLR
jgi:hypothetical protein